MGDTLKKVQPGQRMVIPAQTFNTFIDAARDYLQRQQNQGGDPLAEPRQAGVILVRNDTGEDRALFDILGLDGPVYAPPDNEEGFKFRYALKGVAPTAADHAGNFAVCLEPIADGKIGRCLVQGVTPVKLNVLREDHGFADVVDDGRLSSAPEGPAQVLWKEDGTGEDKWALVRVAETPPQAPFWAEITADGGGAYEWVEVEWAGAGGSQHKTGGRSSDTHGPAYEVNDFDFGASDINPVGQIIQLFPVRTGAAEEYWFHYGPVVGGGDRESFWATITDNANAPLYDFNGDTGESGIAEEVNGVDDIAVGTRVRIFIGDPEEGDYRFEYSKAGALPPMENSFDFIEVWPALVVAAGEPISGRIWTPGSGFPPATGDNYDLTPAGDTVSISFDKVGDGTFADGTLVPCLKDYSQGDTEDWIQVRCQPGAFVQEDAAVPIPPDGHINTFFGTLADQPLPYTVTVEYEVRPGEFKRMYCTRSVDAGDGFKVDLEGDGTGWVKVRDKTWRVELNDCPPANAVMRVRYIPVGACEWSWVETPQTIEGGEIVTDVSTIKEGWIVVDDERKVAHGDPRPCCYAVEVNCSIYIDARGHVMGWYVWNGQYMEWYSPWGHPEPS
ncbi:MAG: hypothetical protein FJ288_03680 [Planctomycetes bacterium]|nr:hypothetical protein [Planctomycetota bacterium]